MSSSGCSEDITALFIAYRDNVTSWHVTKRAVSNRSLPLFSFIFRVELPVMACLYTAHFEAIEIEVALTTTLIAKFIGHFDELRLIHNPLSLLLDARLLINRHGVCLSESIYCLSICACIRTAVIFHDATVLVQHTRACHVSRCHVVTLSYRLSYRLSYS